VKSEFPSIAYYINTVSGVRFGLWSQTGKFLRSCTDDEFSACYMDVPIYKAPHVGMVFPSISKRQIELIYTGLVERARVGGAS
jgi:hypothetical protein